MFGHWFVVASQKTVKIFTEVPDLQGLKEVKEFDNPLGRERTRALIRKQAGRGVKSIGRGSVRYSESKRHDPHEEAAAQFAREVTHYLHKAKQKKSFETLTVAAEPRFLGKLKAAMEPELQSHVSTWLKKDLQKTPQEKLIQVLLPKRKRRPIAA